MSSPSPSISKKTAKVAWADVEEDSDTEEVVFLDNKNMSVPSKVTEISTEDFIVSQANKLEFQTKKGKCFSFAVTSFTSICNQGPSCPRYATGICAFCHISQPKGPKYLTMRFCPYGKYCTNDRQSRSSICYGSIHINDDNEQMRILRIVRKLNEIHKAVDRYKKLLAQKDNEDIKQKLVFHIHYYRFMALQINNMHTYNAIKDYIVCNNGQNRHLFNVFFPGFTRDSIRKVFLDTLMNTVKYNLSYILPRATKDMLSDDCPCAFKGLCINTQLMLKSGSSELCDLQHFDDDKDPKSINEYSKIGVLLDSLDNISLLKQKIDMYNNNASSFDS